MPTIYNRYVPGTTNWETIDFLPDRGVQSAELNEIQALLLDLQSKLGYTLFNNGDIIAGCQPSNVSSTNITIGTGNGAATIFPFTLTPHPLLAGSFFITAGTVSGGDNGLGSIVGTGISSGVLSYTSGVGSVTFSVAPANNVPVTVTWNTPIITISAGKVFINGRVRDVAQQTVTLVGTGNESIGISLATQEVTPPFDGGAVTDASLVDPAVTFDNYGLPGAWRNQVIVTWVGNSSSAVPIFRFQAGLLIQAVIPTQFTNLQQTIGRYIYETNGNYRVSGLKVGWEQIIADLSNIRLVIGQGIGFVEGNEVVLVNAQRVKSSISTSTTQVNNEQITYIPVQDIYPTQFSPMANVSLVTAPVQVTQNLTRQAGVYDNFPLPFTPVNSITSVIQGGTTFIQGTDYQLGANGGSPAVQWLPGGAQPAVGTTYSATWIYEKTAVRGTRVETHVLNESVVRGAGGSDLLAHADLIRIVKISNTSGGPANYIQGIDYNIITGRSLLSTTTGAIAWIPGGSAPAGTFTYFVKYDYWSHSVEGDYVSVNSYDTQIDVGSPWVDSWDLALADAIDWRPSGDKPATPLTTVTNQHVFTGNGAQLNFGPIQVNHPITGIFTLNWTHGATAQTAITTSTGSVITDIPTVAGLVVTGQDATTGQMSIKVSYDGISWSTVTDPDLTDTPNATAYNGSNQYIIVGNNGLIMTSPDGIAWTKRTSGTAGQLNAVTRSIPLNLWVVTGSPGVILTSPDGITWTSRTFPGTAPGGYSVAWSTSLALFIILGLSGSPSQVPSTWTSPDGVTWTQRTFGGSVDTGSYFSLRMIWSPLLTKFVAVTVNTAFSTKIWTSPDGLTFTLAATITGGVAPVVQSIVDSGTALALIISNHFAPSIWTSTNGTAWTSRTVPPGFSGANVSLVWTGSVFLAAGYPVSIASTSGSGVTWNSLPGSSTNLNFPALPGIATNSVVGPIANVGSIQRNSGLLSLTFPTSLVPDNATNINVSFSYLAGSNFIIIYTYYLSRYDAVILNKDSTITLLNGQPALNPRLPSYAGRSMPIAYVGYKPKSLDGPSILYPETDITITYPEIERYTMSDIHSLDDRLTQAEDLMTLTQLEAQALGATTPSDKLGVLTDAFTDFSAVDPFHPLFNMALDLSQGLTKIPTTQVAVSPTINLAATTAKVNAQSVTMQFTETVFLIQPYNTDVTNVNPFDVFTSIGHLGLTPSVDNWIDTTVAPTIFVDSTVINVNGFASAVGKKVWNFLYGWWRKNTQGGSANGPSDWWHHGQYDIKFKGSQTQVNLDSSVTLFTGLEPYLRQSTVAFTGKGWIPGLDLIGTFDSKSVSLTPTGTSTAGVGAGSIRCDATGLVSGTFVIPSKVLAGVRTFDLSGGSPGQQQVDGAANFAGQGSMRTQYNTYDRVTTLFFKKKYVDPVAESFLVPGPNPVYITSLDLFFFSKDATTTPVSVQICDMINGFPGQAVIGEVTLNPSQVNISSNGSVATTFTFADPVLLNPNVEYAIVVETSSDEYVLHYAILGHTDILTGVVLTKQPYAGVLFESSNASTWTPNQFADLKFTMRQANFTNVGTGTIESLFFNNITGQQFTILNLQATQIIPTGSTLQWNYSTDGGGTWAAFIPGGDVPQLAIQTQIEVRVDFAGTTTSASINQICNFILILGQLTGAYTSINVTTPNPWTTIRTILDANLPGGTGLNVYYSIDSGTTWTQSTLIAEVLEDTGRTEFTYQDVLGSSQTQFKMRFDLSTSSAPVQPDAGQPGLRTLVY